VRVEVQQMRRQQCERNIGRRENHNARQHDAARLIAVQQEAKPGRGSGQGQCGNAESRRGGFAVPAETLCQRLDEEAEGVRHNRRKADHDPKEAGENDLPAGVADLRFIE
jgi:hypothetical protein